MGILVAIGVIIFLGLPERWRVTAATNRLVADLRLAHTSATNQLTDWRVVLAFERAEEDEGPDYYLVKLAEAYDAGDPEPTPVQRLPRTFPGNVKTMNVRSAAGFVTDNQGASDWVSPCGTPPALVPQTRTMEFNTDGTMRFPSGPNGSTCVTVDTFPENRVVTLSATSRVKVRPDACLRVRKSETAHYLRQPAKALRVQESGFGARR